MSIPVQSDFEPEDCDQKGDEHWPELQSHSRLTPLLFQPNIQLN